MQPILRAPFVIYQSKKEFQAGVIATVHFKIASRLFQIYQAIQDELVRRGINRERTTQRLVETDDDEHDQPNKHGEKSRQHEMDDRAAS